MPGRNDDDDKDKQLRFVVQMTRGFDKEKSSEHVREAASLLLDRGVDPPRTIATLNSILGLKEPDDVEYVKKYTLEEFPSEVAEELVDLLGRRDVVARHEEERHHPKDSDSTSPGRRRTAGGSPDRSKRRTWWTFYFLPLAVVFLAVFLRYYPPQPQLDLPFLSSLAADAASADQPSIDAGIPLDGVVVAITGATSGIGRGLSKVLHGLGATIVAVGRSPSKLDALRRDLDGELEEGRIATVVADLTDLKSVSRAADEIASRFDSLDYLVNNAGMHYPTGVILKFWEGQSTAQGYDVTFGVNYLSHFLLTERLMPLLEAPSGRVGSPRIVQMSSSFHWLSDGSDLAVDDDGGDIGVSPRASLADARSFLHRERSYANSKLAQILHARALSKRLNASRSKVRAVSVCPGWVGTKVGGAGLTQLLLETIAYPYDGFGLSSTLHAMFLPHAGGGDADYFVNSPLFDLLGVAIAKMGLSGKSWPAATGFRDALSWTAAMFLLWTQRFYSSSGAARGSTSSPESYDETAQDGLFRWSRTAVAEWL